MRAFHTHRWPLLTRRPVVHRRVTKAHGLVQEPARRWQTYTPERSSRKLERGQASGGSAIPQHWGGPPEAAPARALNEFGRGGGHHQPGWWLGETAAWRCAHPGCDELLWLDRVGSDRDGNRPVSGDNGTRGHRGGAPRTACAAARGVLSSSRVSADLASVAAAERPLRAEATVDSSGAGTVSLKDPISRETLQHASTCSIGGRQDAPPEPSVPNVPSDGSPGRRGGH